MAESLKGVGEATFTNVNDGSNEGTVSVHFIDVGQGDSILIEMGTDTIMLIDAGHTGVSIDEEGKSHDKVYGSSNVPKAVTEPYFAYLDEVISHHGGDIDYLIATHSDSDHINMLPAVFKEYQVNNVYINDCYPDFKTSATVKATEEAAEAENNCNVTFFDTADDTVIPVETTEYKFTVYSSGNDGFKKNDSNGMSIMCLLEYGGRKVLFTGDATVATENWFIDKTNDKDFDIDVLKVGHHGSSTSSGAAFLDYVKAEYAVISSGKNNAYGHPTEEVMARLNERHMTTYNTQDDGTIVLYIDGDGDFCFVTEKSAEATE